MEKKIVFTGAIALALVAGAIGGTSLNTIQAHAAEAVTAATNSQPQQGQPQGQFDPTKGGHVGANGVREVLLTGDTAEKVKSAALAAVSGGTIERVETDAEGSPYEAHMTKSDGSHVTVKVDSNFHVTSVENGPDGPMGNAPTQAQ